MYTLSVVQLCTFITYPFKGYTVYLKTFSLANMVFFDSHLIRINGLGKLWLFLYYSYNGYYIWSCSIHWCLISRDVPLLIKRSNRWMADIYREWGRWTIHGYSIFSKCIYTAFLKSWFNTEILTPSLNPLKISIYQDLYFCYTSLIFRRLIIILCTSFL